MPRGHTFPGTVALAPPVFSFPHSYPERGQSDDLVPCMMYPLQLVVPKCEPVHIGKRQRSPEIVSERSVKPVENEREQAPVGCKHHVLIRMLLHNLSNHCDAADLSGRVRFAIRGRSIGFSPGCL